MKRNRPIDAETLPKVWKDGRLYARVTDPGIYVYDGKYYTFATPGTLCLFSLRPEEWTE